MNFKILTDYPSVLVYLTDFLKVSKKNIHSIRMENHHNENSILINNKVANLNSALNSGDTLTINVELQKSNYIPNDSEKIAVDYEDDFLLIASKPFGIKTHPNDITEEDDTLVNYLVAMGHSYLEPIHRLDTDTCGLVIFAKSPLIKGNLDQMLEQRKISRYYSALVKNNIQPQQVVTNIGRDSREKNKMAVTHNGKEAITNILSCKKLEQNVFKVNISLETGRTHQIRVHLAYLKNAILGDRLYSNDSYKFDNMYLGALSTEFIHPVTKEELKVTSSLVDSFKLS